MNRLYKIIFWVGYAAMLAMAMMPLGGNLSKHKVGLLRMDYFLHALVYFAICIYFLIGWKKKILLFEKKPVLKFIFVMVILASVTEVVQLAVPSRTFNPLDWVANLVGLGVGLIWLKIGCRL
jgi:VanZ family protein